LGAFKKLWKCREERKTNGEDARRGEEGGGKARRKKRNQVLIRPEKAQGVEKAL
jgi:hypothetical protein